MGADNGNGTGKAVHPEIVEVYRILGIETPEDREKFRHLERLAELVSGKDNKQVALVTRPNTGAESGNAELERTPQRG